MTFSNNFSPARNNSSSVISYLESRFDKTAVRLPDTPCYFYKGNKSKLEIVVISNPGIGKVIVRIIGLKDYEREPAYECKYDLNGLSSATFQRDIEDLISRMD